MTDLDRTERDGITVTSGSIELRMGAAEDLDSKVAFLSALRRSGQVFNYVDVRYIDAPTFW